MPRTLKRRSDALTQDEEDSLTASPQPTRRRQRSASASSAGSKAENSGPETQSTSTETALVKKLVRLALSAEYARTPLRRTDISTKVLTETHSRAFKPVFAGAQKILRETFGMHLVELPSREKTNLKDRRAQVMQNAARREKESPKESQGRGPNGAGTSGSKTWVLTSVLPAEYKHSPTIVAATRAPSQFVEATYTALYTFIVSLIYLNNGALLENKLERYMRRVHSDEFTPLHMSLEKLLLRMSKDGYVEKRRDTSTGEEVVEWIVGPRAKVEVGATGVVGLVKSVYGFGPSGQHLRSDADDGDVILKEDEDDLDARLQRSLGIKDIHDPHHDAGREDAADAEPGEDTRPRRRGRSRRGVTRDDSDDDD